LRRQTRDFLVELIGLQSEPVLNIPREELKLPHGDEVITHWYLHDLTLV
jgi:hypothetical protein